MLISHQNHLAGLVAEWYQIGQLNRLTGFIDDEVLKFSFLNMSHHLTGRHRERCANDLRFLNNLTLKLLLLLFADLEELDLLRRWFAWVFEHLKPVAFELVDQSFPDIRVQELIDVLVLVQQRLDESDQRTSVVHSVLHGFDCLGTLVKRLLLFDGVSFGSVELLLGDAGVALAVDALERLFLVDVYLLCLNAFFELVVKGETSDLLERFVIHRPNAQNLAFIDCTTAEDFGLRVG